MASLGNRTVGVLKVNETEISSSTSNATMIESTSRANRMHDGSCFLGSKYPERTSPAYRNDTTLGYKGESGKTRTIRESLLQKRSGRKSFHSRSVMVFHDKFLFTWFMGIYLV
jgi:hypothetical protein